MRLHVLAILCVVLLCACNALYQYEFFRHFFGKDEDDYDIIPFVGAWVDGDHMSGSRTAACAAIGTKIYVCGGEDAGGALDLVEVYDTENDTWATVSSLTAPATGHVCVAFDDKIYVFGGSATSSAYYPASDQWNSIASPQQAFLASAMAYDGKIYLFGGALPSGYTCSSTQIYDPVLNSWSQGATMPESRSGAFCAELDGKIYVVGGYHNPEGGPIDSYTATVFEYNPGGDSWIVRSSMTHARAYGCCAAVNGKILILGGFDGNYPGLEYVEAYTPFWDWWQNFTVEPSARSFTCGAAVGTRVYVIGGKVGVSSYTAQTRAFISPW
jgi:N-acetylneuraminic acid mutarotase